MQPSLKSKKRNKRSASLSKETTVVFCLILDGAEPETLSVCAHRRAGAGAVSGGRGGYRVRAAQPGSGLCPDVSDDAGGSAKRPGDCGRDGAGRRCWGDRDQARAGRIIREAKHRCRYLDFAYAISASRCAHRRCADRRSPSVLTVARDGAATNRAASTGGYAKVPGMQLDEYPPAMFQEGGRGASVRSIDPRQNMGADACIGNACRGLPNGRQIRILVVE